MELIKSQYHNCFHINLQATLLRFNKNNKFFWHQAGLFYEKGNNTLPKIITYYKNFKNLLVEFGIDTETYKYENTFDIVNDIKKFTENNYVISLELDSYELPYCLSYHGDHDVHWLEVVDYKNGKFYVYDHYFGYEGEIEESVLLKSLKSLKKHYKLSHNKFYIFKNSNENYTLDEDWHTENIKLNRKVMFDNYLGELITNKNEISVGISAINSLEQDIVIMIDKLKRERNSKLDKEFEHYFVSFKEIAKSRYNYSIYLDELGKKELAEISMVLYQNWIAVANILMKSFYSNNFNDIDIRIGKRLNLIKELEGKLKI
ncbi:hypothetical protein [Bacillus cereus]|uniref:hypothetical protein n=1 Tax=Bacillus cereus TaxID=1396 RepID=UPI00123B9CBB|nr:hypothetical protein [Bacillus cereus]KAA6470408.1 hypothetical protein DX931_28645 [Bacillus cereus]